MGWRAEDRMPELFAKAVQGMKAGEISAVLRSPGGFHVVKLVERRVNDRLRLVKNPEYWDAPNVAMRSIDALALDDGIVASQRAHYPG